jgi:hypothetical protein
MAATTTEGTGVGSVDNVYNKLKNGVVNSSNVVNNSLKAVDVLRKPFLVKASTLTVTEDYAGIVICLDRAAGVTVTLPAATGTGNVYKFVVSTTVTSNDDVIKVANASDSMAGRALACADGGNTINGWEVVSGDDTITLNGGTKGGYVGDTIEIIDIKTNLFLVNAYLNQTASEATPFSATVS